MVMNSMTIRTNYITLSNFFLYSFDGRTIADHFCDTKMLSLSVSVMKIQTLPSAFFANTAFGFFSYISNKFTISRNF